MSFVTACHERLLGDHCQCLGQAATSTIPCPFNNYPDKYEDEPSRCKESSVQSPMYSTKPWAMMEFFCVLEALLERDHLVWRNSYIRTIKEWFKFMRILLGYPWGGFPALHGWWFPPGHCFWLHSFLWFVAAFTSSSDHHHSCFMHYRVPNSSPEPPPTTPTFRLPQDLCHTTSSIPLWKLLWVGAWFRTSVWPEGWGHHVLGLGVSGVFLNRVWFWTLPFASHVIGLCLPVYLVKVFHLHPLLTWLPDSCHLHKKWSYLNWNVHVYHRQHQGVLGNTILTPGIDIFFIVWIL